MQKNSLKSVLDRKINRLTNDSLKKIFVVLKNNYDIIVKQQSFDVMFVEGDRFDFVQGALCGTVVCVNNKPVLTDLAFREIHLF